MAMSATPTIVIPNATDIGITISIKSSKLECGFYS
jgi:hypothetical protein